MSIFLLASFPLYLCLVHSYTPLRSLRFVFWGLVSFIPVYVVSRSIPNSSFFLWSILQVFRGHIWHSREAFFRIVAALVWIAPILLRRLLRKNCHRYESEFLCWLSGYFFALNFHDFLLLGSFPSARELFYGPLSRILFVHLLGGAFACFAAEPFVFASAPRFVRIPFIPLAAHTNGQAIIFGCFALFLAFFVLGLVSSLVTILNAYWFGSVVLLLALCLLFSFSGRILAFPPWANGSLRGQGGE